MKITSLHLLTPNLIETENFYNTVLNIPTYKKTSDEVSFLFGETIVYFKKTELNAEYHIAFEIPKNQLIKLIIGLKAVLKFFLSLRIVIFLVLNFGTLSPFIFMIIILIF